MALIHKDLYQHDNLKGVNTKDYLMQLTENLLSSYSINENKIRLSTDIEEILLDVDTMIPLGLMINELISNALKHAFTDKDEGELKISLKEKNELLKVVVKDNGKGIENIDLMQKKSFGYSLVQSFARKLDAAIDFNFDNGFSIALDIKNYRKI